MVEIRDLQLSDIHLREGFTQCLEELGECELSKRAIKLLYVNRRQMGMRTIVAVVNDNIVGTGSIIIEPKYLHNGGCAGHIEDVAVVSDYQKQGIGKKIVLALIEIAKEANCYKVLLDCDDDVVDFYKKIGFYEMPHNMRMDLYCE